MGTRIRRPMKIEPIRGVFITRTQAHPHLPGEPLSVPAIPGAAP